MTEFIHITTSVIICRSCCWLLSVISCMTQTCSQLMSMAYGTKLLHDQKILYITDYNMTNDQWKHNSETIKTRATTTNCYVSNHLKVLV